MKAPTHAVLAWKGLGPMASYDPTSAAGFPAGSRIVSFRRPSWSDDGRTVFVGVAKWDAKVKESAGEGAPNGEKAGEKGEKAEEKKDDKDKKEPDEPAAVEVWHARDIDVMPRQKINARTDRQRNTLAAWHIDTKRLVPLGTDLLERVSPIRRQRLAYAVNWAPYAMERTIGRPSADVYLIDIDSGARTKVKDAIEDQYLQSSPGGRYLLFFQADQYWTIDTATKSIVNISKAAQTSFVNRESDVTVKQKPSFGVAGWAKDDEGVVLYDKYDAWLVDPDGSGATRLSDGSTDQVRYRYARLDPDEEWIDLKKPNYFSLFGVWSKKSGYARLDAGASRVTPVVLEDKSVTGLGRAKDADVFAYTDAILRASAGCSRRRQRSEGRARSRQDQPVCRRLRMGHVRAYRIQERARRAASGRTLLSGWLPTGQEVSDGRLHVRAAVGRSPSLEQPLGS